MTITNRYTRFLSFVLVLALGLTATGCDSFLSVEDNPNDPDREDALSDPSDVEALIGGSFFAAWRGWMHRDPSTGTAMLSGMLRSPYSYGCCRWSDAGKEPRDEFNNSGSGGWSFNTRPWDDNYSALSSVDDGLTSLNGDIDLGDPDRNARARAWAKMVQGWGHAHIATIFDQGFVLTENTDLSNPKLVDYKTVRDSALKFYDRAIEIAQDASFTTPSTWVRGNELSDEEFIRFVRSLKVRAWTMTPRNSEERKDVSNGGIVDWNKVVQLAQNGLQDDFVIQSDGIGFNSWGMWSLRQPFQGGSPWGRVSYYTIGPADNSGAFEDWLAVRPDTEEPDFFDIETQDRRIVGGEDSEHGKYFANIGGFGSPYAMIRYTTPPRDVRNDDFGNHDGPNQAGEIVFMDHSEMDLMEAEGRLRLEGTDKREVATLINNSRVGQGELPRATVENPVGSWDDRQDNGDPDLGYTQVSHWAMLKHEFYLETMYSIGTIKWAHARGWKDLVEGTPIHFPLPVEELNSLEMNLYTFGGGGEGSAPSGWNR